MASALAVVVCVVVAGMVGEASRFLTRACEIHEIQQSRALTAAVGMDRPSMSVATRPEPAVSEAATLLLRPTPAGERPTLWWRQVAGDQSVAGVMSASFPYRRTVLRAAARHAVDPALVFAIIASESKGDPEAVSPSGAIGLMQLMPDTALELGVDPWKPEENIEGAVRYLSRLLEQFKSVDLSLVAYNAGPGFAQRYREGEVDLGAETRAFIMRVAGLQ